MENYKIVKKLGKGAQGSVFLALDKRDNTHYVLKKVECNDETEANKAFKEAVALEQLKHQYVCGYKEFFVNWDKVEETMYVCIVMEYYETGDLENVLKQQRAKEQALPETILKKWVGQMIEALAFVHGKKVIHRDLKPSNIFMTKDLDISIGDFGVATVMNDARTRTRTTVGTMNWMAPEVLERPYDERSDVWSLGCIILHATTCAIMDEAQSAAVLFDIKHSSQKLEEILKDISSTYSKELCQVIRATLRRKFQQRPTAQDLIKLPYVRACLELSKSKLVEGDRKRADAQNAVKPTTTKRIPETIPDLIKFMADNADRAGCQVMALDEIAKLLAKAGAAKLPKDGYKQIIAAMSAQSENSFVQVSACKVMRVMATSATETDQLFTKDYIVPVLMAMRSHPGSIDLQKEACGLLWALSVNEDAAAVIGQEGGVQDVLATLRDNIDNGDIAQACCGALWSLSVNEENAKIMTEEQGIQDLINAMNTHSTNNGLLEAACAALWTLSVEDENVDMINDLGGVSLMVKALSEHKADAKLVKQACIALSSLVVDENCAFNVVNNDFEIDGIAPLLEILKLHAKDPELIENACSLIGELAEHEDLRELLITKGATEALTRLKIQYSQNADISAVIEEVVDVLSGKSAK